MAWLKGWGEASALVLRSRIAQSQKMCGLLRAIYELSMYDASRAPIRTGADPAEPQQERLAPPQVRPVPLHGLVPQVRLQSPCGRPDDKSMRISKCLTRERSA